MSEITVHDNTDAVFKLTTKGTSCVMKYKGFITDKHVLGDDIIELDEPMHYDYENVGKHVVYVGNHNEYNIDARLYRSNMLGSYVVSHKNYPFMFASFDYTHPITQGGLFQLYVNYEMSDEKKKSIKHPKEYKNLYFYGSWNTCLDADKEFFELWEDMMRDEITNTFTVEDVAKYCAIHNIEDEDVTESVIYEVIEDKLNWYRSIVNKSKYRFTSQGKATKYLVSIATDPRIMDLVKIALKCRVINRRREKDMMDDDEYIIPEKTTNLSSLTKSLLDDDMIVIDTDTDTDIDIDSE